MYLDKFSNPIFDSDDLFESIYNGYQFNSADVIFVKELTEEIKNLQAVSETNFSLPIVESTISTESLDKAWQNSWNMPHEYLSLDIEEWCLGKCTNVEQVQRVLDEIEEFKSRNMLDLLRWLKYFVDTCEKEGVIWGVGRGSSVASYVLYLIGVHSIDPIKYNLDWQEFLR